MTSPLAAPTSASEAPRSAAAPTSGTVLRLVPSVPTSRFARYGRSAASFAALLAIAAASFGISSALRPPRANVLTVGRGTAIETVSVDGTIEVRDPVAIRARIDGPVAQLAVAVGQRVARGQLLARIEAPSVKFAARTGRAELDAETQKTADALELSAVDAQLRSTAIQLELAKADLSQAVDRTAPSIGFFELARLQERVAALDAQLAAQRQQRRALELDARERGAKEAAWLELLDELDGRADVHSPVDGVVLERMVQAGEEVASRQVLLKVGDPRALVLKSAVTTEDAARISFGQEVEVVVQALPGKTLVGHVAAIASDATKPEPRFRLTMTIDSPPPGLRAGMSGAGRVILARHPGALLVRADAVDATDGVWVVDGDRVHRQRITTGIRQAGEVEIVDGLAEGQTVLAEGHADWHDGTKVRTQRVLQRSGHSVRAPKTPY